jgi:hypothetical protein
MDLNFDLEDFLNLEEFDSDFGAEQTAVTAKDIEPSSANPLLKESACKLLTNRSTYKPFQSYKGLAPYFNTTVAEFKQDVNKHVFLIYH